MSEKYPQLLILPNPENNSFDLVITHDHNHVDSICVGEVLSVKWLMEGVKPDWLMAHKQAKTEKRRGISGLPSAPTIRDFAVFGAIHFFGEGEFTSRQLSAEIRETYPNLKNDIRPITLSQHLHRSKLFKNRPLNNTNMWKYVGHRE